MLARKPRPQTRRIKRPCRAVASFLLLAICWQAPAANAFEAFDDRIQLHGYFETQLRALNADFSEDWDITQWYNILNLELELEIAPEGFGPFDLVSGFVRAEARFDCIYSRSCGLMRSTNAYGDRSKSLPRRLSNGTRNLYGGQVERRFTTERTADGERFEDPDDPRSIPIQFVNGERISGGHTDPLPLGQVNGFQGLARAPGADFRRGEPTSVCPTGAIGLADGCNRFAGGKQQPGDEDIGGASSANEFLRDPNTGELLNLTTDDPFVPLFRELADYRFTQINGRGGSNAGHPILVLGPWRPKDETNPIATFADRINPFDSSQSTSVVRATAFNGVLRESYDEIFDRELNRIPITNPFRRLLADQTAKQEAVRLAIDAALAVRGDGARDFRPIPYAPPGDGGKATALARGLYIPSPGLREEIRSGRLDRWDFNFDESQRAWNRGASQRDEKELKEAYLDLELLDSSLWLRLGKQSIVWGKTELFRTTDQMNPQDLGLTSLATLEESRIALWSARAVYSLYDLGPLEDVRLELAINYDDFQPSDLGACGEAYVVNITCSLTFGGFAHGFTGVGIAGIDLPPSPWTSLKGWEVGGRAEFRVGSFGVAISDFYGYPDLPYARRISTFERNVDPGTGRPRAAGKRGPCARNDVAGPLGIFGGVIVGHDPDCLRPGPTDRTVRTTGNPALRGFATRRNNQFRADPEAIAGTTAAGRFFIPRVDTRRSPIRLDDFDSSLIAVDAQGNGILDPAGPFGYRAATSTSPNNALDAHHANLTFFNLVCASTAGFSDLDPAACAPTLFASQEAPPADNVFDSVSELFARLISGDAGGVIVGSPAIAGVIAPLVQLSNDSEFLSGPNARARAREERVSSLRSCRDGNFSCDEDEFEDVVRNIFQFNAFLTAEQEALLGCGPFWGNNCDRSGLDLLNAEASALFQSFVGFEGTNNRPGGWRTDGLEPFVNPQALGFTNDDPTRDRFLTDGGLIAAGRPSRYAQPGTVGFQGGPVCTTTDIGGAPDEILPGCRRKWRSLDGIGRFQTTGGSDVSGLNLFDSPSIFLTDEGRFEIQGVDIAGDLFCSINRSHPLCVGGPSAVTRANPFGRTLGGELDGRSDPRSWSFSVDGNPDRIAFNPTGFSGDGSPAIVFRGCVNDSSIPLENRIRLCGTPAFPAAGHPFTGQPFASEMAGLSWNLMTTLVAFSDNYRANLPDPDNPNARDGGPLAFSIYDPGDPANYDNGDPLTGNLVVPEMRKPICSFITPGNCSAVLAFLGFAGQKRNVIAAGGNGRYGRRTFGWHSGGEVILAFKKRNVVGLGLDFNEDYTKTTWGLESTWIRGVPSGDANSLDGITQSNQFNLTLAVDRSTFINFLNPNRSFFMTTQWFFQYVDGYKSGFSGTGPWNILGILNVSTGYFQDRLMPSLLLLYDVRSVSGGALPQVTYRFNENFSATVGAALYFGRRRLVDMGVNPIGAAANRVDDRNTYKDSVESGLSVIRNRDEVFVRLRYTF